MPLDFPDIGDGAGRLIAVVVTTIVAGYGLCGRNDKVRTKEAIAILKGFLRREVKGPADSGDAIFARGVLAGVEWLTMENRPCPYAELEEDFDDAGGWMEEEGAYPDKAKHQAMTPPNTYQLASRESNLIIPSNIPDPYANLPKPQIIIPEEYQGLMNLTQEEIAAASGSGNQPPIARDNTRFRPPDSIEAAAERFSWVKALVEETGQRLSEDFQGESVAVTDRNAVIVGQGLQDEPTLTGNWE